MLRQEEMARSKGLTKLYDATGKIFDANTFTELQGELNPNLLVVANPEFL